MHISNNVLDIHNGGINPFTLSNRRGMCSLESFPSRRPVLDVVVLYLHSSTIVTSSCVHSDRRPHASVVARPTTAPDAKRGQFLQPDITIDTASVCQGVAGKWVIIDVRFKSQYLGFSNDFNATKLSLFLGFIIYASSLWLINYVIINHQHHLNKTNMLVV